MIFYGRTALNFFMRDRKKSARRARKRRTPRLDPQAIESIRTVHNRIGKMETSRDPSARACDIDMRAIL